MSPIVPNCDQLQELAQCPEQGPVVMVNLLKFKVRAEGGGGSGADAYARYGGAVVKMIETHGGRLLWAGRGDQILIGDPAEDWDAVLLVWYPSRRAFVDMVTTPAYQEAHAHREGGLERTVVIACTPLQDRTGERR